MLLLLLLLLLILLDLLNDDVFFFFFKGQNAEMHSQHPSEVYFFSKFKRFFGLEAA